VTLKMQFICHFSATGLPCKSKTILLWKRAFEMKAFSLTAFFQVQEENQTVGKEKDMRAI
jgi:hypothetical protein